MALSQEPGHGNLPGESAIAFSAIRGRPNRSDSFPVPDRFAFWLTIIFASFSLFSRLGPINVAALLVFAISASGAVFLILELSQPFAGLMKISDAPLLDALAPLKR